MCNTSLWNFFFVSRLYLYLRVEKLKNRKERDRTVDRLSNEYLSSRFGKQASTIAVTEYRSGSIEFSRKRLAFSRGGIVQTSLYWNFHRADRVLLPSDRCLFCETNRVLPRLSRTELDRFALQHSGDDLLVHARSLEERLIIIRRSSIEQCFDGAASLSRCDPRSSIAAETT